MSTYTYMDLPGGMGQGHQPRLGVAGVRAPVAVGGSSSGVGLGDEDVDGHALLTVVAYVGKEGRGRWWVSQPSVQ